MPLYDRLINPNGVADGRLTLSSGTAVPQTNLTAQTTIYYTPFTGGSIALYNGKAWDIIRFAEVSVAVPSTVFRIFDIYGYNSSGSLAIETLNWNQTTAALTAATAAAPCVITSNAHGLSNGDQVGIAGIVGTLGTNTANGVNGKVWTVAGAATNTFQLQGSDTSGLTYTSGGTWYKQPNTRATALTTQDGVTVKTGDATRRYLGTGMTTATSGQCEDSTTRRLLWNWQNRVPRALFVSEGTASWTYSTSGYRCGDNDSSIRFELVIGAADVVLVSESLHKAQNASTTDVYGALGEDSTTAVFSSQIPGTETINGGYIHVYAFGYHPITTAGYHYYQWLEQASGVGTTTWFGSGLTGATGVIQG